MIALEYSVKDRTGRERLRTPDKKEAAAFARRMNHADGLGAWLRAAGVAAQVDDDALYDITLHLACHPREVQQLLRGQAASDAPGADAPSPPAVAAEPDAGPDLPAPPARVILPDAASPDA